MNTKTSGTDVPNLSDAILEKLVWFDPEGLEYCAPDARQNTDEQIDQIRWTIHDFRGAQPVVTDSDDVVIAGQGRVEAAWLLDIDEIPALPWPSLTKKERKHYVNSFTKFAKYAGWSREMIEIDLQHLKNYN